MKKFFTLVIVSLLSAMAVEAQKVVINKKDGSKVVVLAKDVQMSSLLQRQKQIHL